MAVKDHSLDEKIVTAAREAFLSQGFQGASIHKIAQQAGVTTGAIYTRYKNKDALFCSLIQEAMEELYRRESAVAELYYRVKSGRDLPLFLKAMEEEMQIHMDVIFRYYDQCVLLFCRGSGSSAEKLMEQGLEQKVRTTVDFLRKLSGRELPEVELLIRQQAELFRLILERSYDREKTVQTMGAVLHFQEAGWKQLFEENMP